MAAVSKETELQNAKLWMAIRKNPTVMLDRGIFNVLSQWRIDENGFRVFHEGDPFPQPFVTNRWQKLFFKTVDFAKERHKNKSASIVICKDRRRSSTMAALGRQMCNATAKGWQCLVTTQHTKTAIDLMRNRVNIFWDSPKFAPFKNNFRLESDTQESLIFSSNSKYEIDGERVYECTLGGITIITASTIDQYRGGQLSSFLATEAAFYEDPRHINAVVGPLMHRFGSERYIESTANGEDSFFCPAFMEAWKMQNRANWFDPEYKVLGNKQNEALYYPFYTNESNIEEIPSEEIKFALLRDLDEEEKEIHRLALIYHERDIRNREFSRWTDIQEQANVRSLGNILFRRSHLPDFYQNVKGIVVNPYAVETKEKFRAEYSYTPEQAFAGSKNDLALGNKVVSFFTDYANNSSPVWTGDIEFRDNGYHLDELPENSSRLKVYKWPHLCRHVVSLSVDPCAFRENSSLEEHTGDETAIVSFDWETGEQVLEFFAQESSVALIPRIYAIAQFLATDGDYFKTTKNIRQNKFPYLTEEAQAEAVISNTLVSNFNYPSHMVYRQSYEDVSGIRRSAAYGWIPGNRKTAAVAYLAKFLKSGMDYISPPEGAAPSDEPRMIPKSKKIAKQMSTFIQKERSGGQMPLYQAVHKGDKHPDRYDDGVSAMYIDAAAQRDYIREFGPVGRRKEQVSVEVSLTPFQVSEFLSVEDSVKLALQVSSGKAVNFDYNVEPLPNVMFFKKEEDRKKFMSSPQGLAK